MTLRQFSTKIEMGLHLLQLTLVLLLVTIFTSATEDGGLLLVEDVAQGPGSNPAVPALFIFGDSVLDAGTNNFFPSLLRANFKPYGTQFGKPTGRFTNGRTYADFVGGIRAIQYIEDTLERDLSEMANCNCRANVIAEDHELCFMELEQTDVKATYVGLPLVEPYLKRKGKRRVIMGVNYASAGSGLLRTSNAQNVVIPFPDQIVQFGQTKTQIEQTLESKPAVEELFSKSLFLVNIGANDIVGYIFNASVPPQVFFEGLLVILNASVEVLYEAGARKVLFLGVGPLGCVPGVLAAAGLTNGTCAEPWNVVSQGWNAALEQFVYSLNETFPDIKAIVGKPYSQFNDFSLNAENYGFTAGLTACCGSGIYNAAVQCGRPADVITNPPTNLCDDVTQHVFWDYYHPTEKAYAIFAEELWSGNSSFVAPVNLRTLVSWEG